MGRGTGEPGVAEAFATCEERFRWLIYDEAGRPRSADICRGLREGFAFAVGRKDSTDVIDQTVPELFGNYTITMRVPEWPHRPEWTGEFDAAELTARSSRKNGVVEGFTSSLWRPAGFCACCKFRTPRSVSVSSLAERIAAQGKRHSTASPRRCGG